MRSEAKINPQKHGLVVLLAAVSLLLGGASCEKKSAAEQDDYEGVGEALDRSEGGDGSGEGGGDAKPIPGVDLSALDDEQKQRFHEIVDSLPSPCGKAHSLRTSATEDESCKRSIFGVRYVVKLIGDGARERDVRDLYEKRYEERERHQFSLEGIPHSGPEDAAIKVVEYFDYGCPHCKSFLPVLDRVRDTYPSDVAVYYRFFPLSGNPNGVPAAKAAVAAHEQGKFDEMHSLLFANQRRHDKSSLMKYAKDLGLDMAKFREDFEAAEAHVMADKSSGEKAGVRGTPTLFINGLQFAAPDRYDYIKMWIDEALAVNR